jgi:hypothetical protein
MTKHARFDFYIPALLQGFPPRCGKPRRALCLVPVHAEIVVVEVVEMNVLLSVTDRIGEFVVGDFGGDPYIRIGMANTAEETTSTLASFFDRSNSAVISVFSRWMEGAPIWPSGMLDEMAAFVETVGIGKNSFARMVGKGLGHHARPLETIRDVDMDAVEKEKNAISRSCERMVICGGYLWMHARSPVVSLGPEGCEFHDISYLRLCRGRGFVVSPFDLGRLTVSGTCLDGDSIVVPLFSSAAHALIGHALPGLVDDFARLPVDMSDYETEDFAASVFEIRCKAGILALYRASSRFPEHIVVRMDRAATLSMSTLSDGSIHPELEAVMCDLLEMGVIKGHGQHMGFGIIRKALNEWDGRLVSVDLTPCRLRSRPSHLPADGGTR